MSQSLEASRFAHLIYTSDRQGFGVKDSSGSWLPDESAAVRQHISPSVSFGVEIPSNYSPERDEPLPRRVVWTKAGEHGMALWHSVPVEPDFTGRSGSVFAQCLLDRTPTAPSTVRPIDWWGSPDLQTPYFVSDYSSARLSAEAEPRPGPALSRDSLYLYLTSQGPLIRNLLDATYAAMHGGPPVVLGMATQASAALAIGVVSHLMSPQTARTLRFSMLETTGAQDSLTAALGRDLHIIVVPTAHFEELRPDDKWLLLDEWEEREGPELVGRRHTLSTGQTIQVTPWSVLAWSVFEWGASSDFERLDDVSAQVGGDLLDQAVPLAMLVASDPDSHDETVQTVAGDVLMQSGPRNAAHLPEDVGRAIQRAISTAVGSTLDDARAAVARLLPGSSAEDWVLRTYLDRLADQPSEVLAGTQLPRDGLVVRGEVVEHLTTRIRDQLQQVPPRDHASFLLRLLDHVVRLGFRVEDPANARALTQCRELLQTGVVDGQILSGEHLDAIGPIDERTLAAIVRPALVHAWRDGQEIATPMRAELYAWLYPTPPEPGRMGDGLHFAGVVTRLREGRPSDDAHAMRLELLTALSERRDPPLVAAGDRDGVLSDLVTMAPLTEPLLQVLRTFDPIALPEPALVDLILQDDVTVARRPPAVDALRQRQSETGTGMLVEAVFGPDPVELATTAHAKLLAQAGRAGATMIRTVPPERLGPAVIGYLAALAAIGNVDIIRFGEQQGDWAADFESMDHALTRRLAEAVPHTSRAFEDLLRGARRHLGFAHMLVLIDAVASNHLDQSHGRPTVFRMFRIADESGHTAARQALQRYLDHEDLERILDDVPRFVKLNPLLADTEQRAVKIEKALVAHWRRCSGRERGLSRFFGLGSKKPNEHLENH